jgi:hypothetical protein
MQITLNDQIAAFTKQGLILNANNTNANNFIFAGPDRTSAELKQIAEIFLQNLSRYTIINRKNADKYYAVFIIDKPTPEPDAKGLIKIQDFLNNRATVQIFNIKNNSWAMNIKFPEVL